MLSRYTREVRGKCSRREGEKVYDVAQSQSCSSEDQLLRAASMLARAGMQFGMGKIMNIDTRFRSGAESY